MLHKGDRAADEPSHVIIRKFSVCRFCVMRERVASSATILCLVSSYRIGGFATKTQSFITCECGSSKFTLLNISSSHPSALHDDDMATSFLPSSLFLLRLFRQSFGILKLHGLE